MNKTLLLLVPAALCWALAQGVHGAGPMTRSAQQPDTAIVDDNDDGGLLFEDDSMAYADADTVVSGDSIDYDDDQAPAEVCPADDELLSQFDTKDADYSMQDKANADCGVTFAALIYTPGEGKPRAGFDAMVSNVLRSVLPDQAAEAWKPDAIDKMLEAKWRAVKASYQSDVKEQGPMLYSYRTNITPAWQWKTAGGLTTYKVDDETYMGGAHGMTYSYYLTLGEQKGGLLGLTDIFKEQSLPQVFALVAQKLASRPNAPTGDDTWKQVAEMSDDDAWPALRYSSSVEQYQGKWYPRPALTQCGVVFSYQPYVKDCYAAGTINVLLTYDEVADWLNLKP